MARCFLPRSSKNLENDHLSIVGHRIYVASLFLVEIAGISTRRPSGPTWKRVLEESPSTRHTDGCRTWASVGDATESVSTQMATTAPTTSEGGKITRRRCRNTKSEQSSAYLRRYEFGVIIYMGLQCFPLHRGEPSSCSSVFRK